MTLQELLAHQDSGAFWPPGHRVAADGDLARATATALAVRALREARGEAVAGYKLGWTHRAAWPRLGVSGPMWGTLHASSVTRCDGAATLALGPGRLPRLEPELVVAFGQVPAPGADLDALAAGLAWMAPGFEIVVSHLPDWRYAPAQTIADGAVHGALVVGRPLPVPRGRGAGAALARTLADARMRLHDASGRVVAEGRGANVLGDPLHALQRFLADIAATPGVRPPAPGELVTTGTWTDAVPVAPGQTWRADFDAGLGSLSLALR